ncbi:MAG: PUA domain-containing protein [Halodesulfurarchaeum sp.]
MTTTTMAQLRTIADYQFGAGAGDALFPPNADLEVHRSASGRPRQLFHNGGRLASLRTDGRFTLGLAGGKQLATALEPDAYRVAVGDESEPFVREGKNVFAKFVRRADDAIRAGDEVLIEHEEGHLVAVGRAELDATAMRDFETGMAVKVRESAER